MSAVAPASAPAASLPAADEYGPSFAGYISRVPPGDVIAQLERQIATTVALLKPLDATRAQYRYAPDKWSVTEIVGHLADAERIFAYRALRFARADQSALPGFDENAYMPPAEFGTRSLADVLGEFQSVRAASLTLFRGLPDAAWTRSGTASGHRLSVRAAARIISGHELHHVEVLRARYGVGSTG